MPAQTTTSALVRKLGREGQEAVIKHRNDEIKVSGGGQLPGGIENGVARLTKMYVKEVDKKDSKLKGELFFYAEGTVLMPRKHTDGSPLFGLQTRVTEMLCNTPTRSRKTVSQHLKWVMDLMRSLGVDGKGLTLENLEVAMAALVKQAPTFRFRTWKPPAATEGPFKGKESQVLHLWGGVVDLEESGEPGAEEGGVQDDTPTEEPGEEGSGGEEGSEGETSYELPLDETAGGNGEVPNEDDPDAITAAALAAGITQQQVDAATSWDEVKEMTTVALASKTKKKPVKKTTTPSTNGAAHPAEGEVWRYKKDAKSKPVDVLIKSINEANGTADATDLAKKTHFKGLKFSQLEAV